MKKENKRLQFAQKIGMTILLLLLIRFMSHIPVPGVKHSMFKLAVAGKGNGYFQLYDRLTGGSFSNMTILVLVLRLISQQVLLFSYLDIRLKG